MITFEVGSMRLAGIMLPANGVRVTVLPLVCVVNGS